MAVEKGHGNLMLHTEKLYQRGKRELQESASVNTTWNSLFRLLARMHCRVSDTQNAAKYQGNVQGKTTVLITCFFLLRMGEEKGILSV